MALKLRKLTTSAFNFPVNAILSGSFVCKHLKDAIFIKKETICQKSDCKQI
jgi:hypothetical protein